MEKVTTLAARAVVGLVFLLSFYNQICGQNPAGITTAPVLWLRADVGVNTSAGVGLPGSVLSWADQSPLLNNANASTATAPQLVAGAVNFNPAIRFDPAVDPMTQLVGTNQLDLLNGADFGEMTIFVVPIVRDQDATCGSDIFNFFDDESLFEVESFGPNNGCEAFVQQETYGVFNGFESFLTGAIDSRRLSILGLDYNGMIPTSASVNGSAVMGGQVNPYQVPEVSAGETYSIGQAANNAGGVAADVGEVAEFDMVELIIYNTVLSLADRQKVNTYIALKYGVTLGHDYISSNGVVLYDPLGANMDYSNEITGIGRDDAANLDQQQSTSTSNETSLLTIGFNQISATNQVNQATGQSFFADQRFLLVGNNAVESNFIGTGGPADYQNLFGTIWKAAEWDGATNNDVITDLDLAFDKITGNLTAPDDSYFLLIDRDGDCDFSNVPNTEVYTGVTVGDQLVFEEINLNHDDCFTLARHTCNLNIVGLDIDCQNDDEFEISIDVSYNYEYLDANTDQIIATFRGDTAFSGPLNTATDVVTIGPLAVTGSGFQDAGIAQFLNDLACSDGGLITLADCENACSAGPTEISGQVFVDGDVNSVKGPLEEGFFGVTINAYDQDGNLSTTLTDNEGNYFFTGLDPAKTYRIELVPPGALDIALTYSIGMNTSGEAYTKPGVCNFDFGGINRTLCPPDKLQYLAVCFSRADNVENDDVLISFSGVEGSNGNVAADYRSPVHPVLVGAQPIGAVYGLAYDRFGQRIYTSAFVRGDVELAGSVGQVYLVDNDSNRGNDQDVGNGNVSNFIDLNSDGSLGTFVPETTGNGLEDGLDDVAFVASGKLGIGDLELSSAGDLLYATDLTNGRLLEIPIPADGSTPAFADVNAIDLPANACTGGVLRPFGLGNRNLTGQMYVGAVCDASISMDVNDLVAKVFEFTPGSGTINATPVLEFPLNYARQKNFASRLKSEWNYWVDEISIPGPGEISQVKCCGDVHFMSYAQPILGDIEFSDDGNMIIGMADRFAYQVNKIPEGSTKNPTPGVAESLPAGDILQAALLTSGTWEIEMDGRLPNAAAGPLVSLGADIMRNAGPGGDEFYYQDNYSPGRHNEVTLGALSQVPGFPIASTAWDPVFPIRQQYATGGVTYYSNDNGSWVKSVLLYDDDTEPNAFNKGAGFGDLEGICAGPTEFQIGNYVWVDNDFDNDDTDGTDNDGISGPEEPALAGVPVALYSSDGTLRATTVTNANGEYYFTGAGDPDEMWVDPNDLLQFQDSVIVVFGTDGTNPVFDVNAMQLSLNGSTYEITTQDTGEGVLSDRNDSDISLAPNDGNPWDGFPIKALRVSTGLTNFTFDAGFKFVPFDLALRKTIDTPSLPSPVIPGSQITYKIEVINQGQVTGRRINVRDYIPEGTSYVTSSGPSTTENGNAIIVTTSPSGIFMLDSLVAADSVELTLVLKIDTDFPGGNLDNFAEIQSADNDNDATTDPPVDIDSTPDATAGNVPGESNDPTVNDNVTNQDGKNGGDEDDYDGARVNVLPCPTPNCGGEPSGE